MACGVPHDFARQPRFVHRARDYQRAQHAGKSGSRSGAAAGTRAPGHQRRQQIEYAFDLGREGASDGGGLPRHIATERGNQASAARPVAMRAGQVAFHDPAHSARRRSVDAAFPSAAGLREREANRLDQNRALRAEMTVQAAVGQTGGGGNRIDTGTLDSPLAEQPRCRDQYLFAITRGCLFRHSHPDSSASAPGLLFLITCVTNMAALPIIINPVLLARCLYMQASRSLKWTPHFEERVGRISRMAKRLAICDKTPDRMLRAPQRAAMRTMQATAAAHWKSTARTSAGDESNCRRRRMQGVEHSGDGGAAGRAAARWRPRRC